MTDRYELTMLQAALRSGKSERECVFEVFTRQLPSGRRYGVLAGVGRVLDAIADFSFGFHSYCPESYLLLHRTQIRK